MYHDETFEDHGPSNRKRHPPRSISPGHFGSKRHRLDSHDDVFVPQHEPQHHQRYSMSGWHHRSSPPPDQKSDIREQIGWHHHRTYSERAGDNDMRSVSYSDDSRKRPTSSRDITCNSDKRRPPQLQVSVDRNYRSYSQRKQSRCDNDCSDSNKAHRWNETRRLPKGGRSKSWRQSNNMESKPAGCDPDILWDLDDMKHTASKDIRFFDKRTISHIRKFLRCHQACSEISQLVIFLKILSNMISSMNEEKIGIICNAQAKELVSDLNVFSSECIPFWGGLAMTIKSLPYVQVENPVRVFASRMLDLMDTIMMSDEEIIKKAIPFLPLDEFFGALKQLDNGQNCYRRFSEKVEDFVTKRDEFRDSLKAVKTCHENVRQDRMSFLNQLLNFIYLSGKPTLSDLQPNKVKGCFSSKTEYLQIHFDLLKKDFLFPLQSTLHHAQQNASGHDLKAEDYYIYSNVFLVGRDILNYSLVHKIKFHLPRPKSANYWEHSKRFTFGSLVCFSEDKFQSIVFGVIADRKTEDLKKGIVGIRLVEHPESLILQENVKYQMIESPVYLEAYSPVLARLEQLRKHPGDLAFEKYLVDCNTEVSSPAYLQNMRLALDDTELGSFRDQFQLDSLDQSQMSALQLAFDNEVALIQGPPGTGKTFIGVKFVELLLKNRALWKTNSSLNRPIAVLCFTNHALDQFLENILQRLKESDVHFNMVRIGSRSKSDTLKEFNLSKRLQEMHRSQSPMKKHRHFRLKRFYPQVRAMCDALLELCELSNYSHINEELYFSFLHPDELQGDTYRDLDDVQTYNIDQLLIWFDIQINEMAKANITDSDLFDEEADRISALRGSAVIEMAKNGRKDLQAFFEYLLRVLPIKHRVSSTMTRRQKVELFKYCLNRRYRELKDGLAELQDSKNVADQDEEKLKVEILKRADIIGFTTNGASSHNQILTKVGCKIFIVEEAAEILESHVIAALTRDTQHLVMIGDHKQLRPKTNDFAIGKKYGLEISLFERLINNNFPYATLTNQHRMRPEISRLIHPHIYPELNDDESVLEYPNVEGIIRNVSFISHHENEEEMEDLRSPSNNHEASFLASLCYYLLQQGYKESMITILTPYVGQVVCLKQHLDVVRIKGIRIVTIDHYQGEENDIVLLSLVRSKKPGFVKDDNRICVALSRAKIGFYCIGNFDLFVKHSMLWENVIESMKKEISVSSYLPLICKSHNEISLVCSPRELNEHAEGGCLNLCNARLDCGHICSKKCHPYDPEIGHPNNCDKPCARKCEAGEHQCKKKCNEKCQCKELVNKKLSCDHTQLVCCDEDPNIQACNKPCEKILKCGHPCKKLCGQSCTDKCQYLIREELPCGHKAQRLCSQSVFERMNSCEAKCGVELDCGHTCTGTCGKCNQGRLHVPCKKHCGRILVCGHVCSVKCSQTCPPCKEQCPVSCSHGKCGHICGKPCISCAEPCEWSCEHYQCTKPCGEICDIPPCNEPCKEKLSCDHPCIGLCKEICPKVCRVCKPDHEDFEVFFGSEDEKDARFIQLKDCGHLIEYTALDQYMEQKSDEAIGFKKCPKCSTVISNPPLRYCNSIKKLKQDMNRIKIHSSSYSRKERPQIIQEILEMDEKTPYLRKGFKIETLHSCDDAVLQKYQVSLNALSINWSRTDDAINQEELKAKTYYRNELTKVRCEYLRVKKQVFSLHGFVKSCKSLPCLPLQALNDIQRERQRLTVLLKCYELQANIIRQQITLTSEEENIIDLLRINLNPSTFKPPLCESNQYEKYMKVLESLQEEYGIGNGLSKEEMREIVETIGSRKGSWYKCPKGHLYNIGQCGGATQVGTCPDCGSAIGGTGHRLLESNAHDGTVDDSHHAAWSEGANMNNFDLDNLF